MSIIRKFNDSGDDGYARCHSGVPRHMPCLLHVVGRSPIRLFLEVHGGLSVGNRTILNHEEKNGQATLVTMERKKNEARSLHILRKVLNVDYYIAQQ